MNIGRPEAGAPRVEPQGPRSEQRAQFENTLRPEQLQKLNELVPSNRLIKYGGYQPTREVYGAGGEIGREKMRHANEVYVDDLFALAKSANFAEMEGKGMSLFINSATTAQTPEQLQNAFRSMGFVAEEWSPSRPDIGRFYSDGKISPQSIIRLEAVTPNAQLVIDKLMDQYTSDNPQSIAQIIKVMGNMKPEYRKYTAEAYLDLVTSGKLSPEDAHKLVMALPKMTFMKDQAIQKEVFGSSASFWQEGDEQPLTFEGESAEAQANPGDPLEVALLKGKIRQLEASQRKWLTDKATLEGNVHAERAKSREAIGKAHAERDQAAQELTRLKLENERLRQSGAKVVEPKPSDIFGRFLYGNFLTLDQIYRMPPEEGAKIVKRLEAAAGQSMHSDLGVDRNVDGINPHSIINQELHKLKKHFAPKN